MKKKITFIIIAFAFIICLPSTLNAKANATVATVNPTDYVFYVNGDATSGVGQCILLGDMYVNGSLSITNGTTVKGEIVSRGNAIISGAATNTCDSLICTGNLTLSYSAKINGNALVGGDIVTSGSAKISGNAYANGSLTMSNGYINGDTVVGHNAAFSGGAQVLGALTYYGTANPSNLASYVVGTITKNTTVYTPIDFSAYIPQELSALSRPEISASPPTMVNKVISSSGTLTTTLFDAISLGSTVTIDTTNQDINLLIDNTIFAPGNMLCFEITGPHNLYIYLKGNAQFNLGAMQYFGMHNRGTNPQIFIIGDTSEYTQSVNLSSVSELDACIYMPFGKFNASGGTYDYGQSVPYKFVGSCTVKSLVITNNVPVLYSPSYLSGTPLECFIGETVDFGEFDLLPANYISNIEPGTTVENLMAQITPVGGLLISGDKNGKITTGTNIAITKNGTVTNYTTIIFGDVSGDGDINLSDLLVMKKQVLGIGHLDITHLKAGDLLAEGNITINSLIALKKSILKIKPINQKTITQPTTTTTTGTTTLSTTSATSTTTASEYVSSINVTGSASAISTNMGTIQMVATVYPSNAINKTVVWSVSDTARAKIDANTGLLTAMADGTVTVKATAMDGSNISRTSSTITFTNQTIKVTSFVIMAAGGATRVSRYSWLQLSATSFLPATVPIANKKVTWEVNNPSYASIDSTGRITAGGTKNVSIIITATSIDGWAIKRTIEIMITS